MSEDKAIEMFVGGLVLDPNTQAPVVVLKDESGEIHLPIWIGISEATAIASAIKEISMGRPLTHDLMYTVLGEMGGKIEQIVITELKDQTYYSELVVSFGDKMFIFDSRPSDAIALALRAEAPIYVAQAVLDEARTPVEEESAEGEGAGEKQVAEGANESEGEEDPSSPDFKNIDKEKWEELLEDLGPDDFKYKT